MFERISDSLTNISNSIRGRAYLTEANLDQILREIRMALIEADVALPVIRDFIAQVKEQALGQKVLQSLTPGQMFIGIFAQQLEKSLGYDNNEWVLPITTPAIIILAGLQGSGKTTHVAKLGNWFYKQKKKVLLVSCDIHRPAAIEQLSILAKQINCDCYTLPDQISRDPVEIASNALNQAKTRLYDVLLVDTAGRLTLDQAMMDELSAISNTLNPNEIWLTVDAMQGQDAINTAKSFSQKVAVSGLILTKADGDARGGAILGARIITNAPVRFMGVSERIDGLERFDPKRIADRILGKGDMIGLFEQAQSRLDTKVLGELASQQSFNKNFDLTNFRQHLVQMTKIGDFDSIIEKMPAVIRQYAQTSSSQFSEKSIKKMVGIIDSMTKKERQFPDLIKAARKKRIARGSGVSVQEVNKLCNQFEQFKKITKNFKQGFTGLTGLPGIGKLGNINNLKKIVGNI